MSRSGYLIVTLLVALAGCSGQEAPPAVQGEMVSLYCDLALAGGVTGEAAPDSVRGAIHRRHGITYEQLEEALGAYRRDPRGWVGFFAAVVETLEARTLP